MRILKILVAVAAVGSLAGCMANDTERALAGAVGGAVVADVLDTNVAAGAAVGAAAGALCDDAGFCR
ncbi:hypothetical protein NHN26_11075 [Rhodovulum tesquicola]|uniref:hypothetical protein n=1 Tax=Rhodovulum tesquicola TaxID=540254 RepID=UPI0020978E8A|nr:hypothetical protein [Rhodovulum tesquicola]MCO8145770.1 hypothetical protein [Rhodovulum tesquicola]